MSFKEIVDRGWTTGWTVQTPQTTVGDRSQTSPGAFRSGELTFDQKTSDSGVNGV